MRELNHFVDGRWYRVALPNNVGDEEAAKGIIIGPPDLDELGLPKHIADHLHNSLFGRGLITFNDVRLRPQEVFAALQESLGVSTTKIMSIYQKEASHA